MENIKIENGKIYNNAQGKADIFQIVEKALKSKRKGYISNKKRAYAELTIDIFRRICK